MFDDLTIVPHQGDEYGINTATAFALRPDRSDRREVPTLVGTSDTYQAEDADGALQPKAGQDPIATVRVRIEFAYPA